MDPDLGAESHCRERLRLGEDLGVRPDADFEILRPEPTGEQSRLQLRRHLGPGLDRTQIDADLGGERAADRVGGTRIALRLLLDHALDHACGEGDAGRLDRLAVDRRQQPGQRRIAARRIAVPQQRLGRSQPPAAPHGPQEAHRIIQLEQGRYRRGRCADIVHAVVVDRDHGRPATGARQPGATDPGAGSEIVGRRIVLE